MQIVLPDTRQFVNAYIIIIIILLFTSSVTTRRNDTTLQMTVTDSSVVEMVLLEIVTASLERDMSGEEWHERVTCYGTYKLQERLAKMRDLASTISTFCRFVEQTDSAVVLDVRILILSTFSSIFKCVYFNFHTNSSPTKHVNYKAKIEMDMQVYI